MSNEVNYDEMVEAMNKGANRMARISNCLRPEVAEMLGLGEEYELSFSSFSLSKVERGWYELKIYVKPE